MTHVIGIDGYTTLDQLFLWCQYFKIITIVVSIFPYLASNGQNDDNFGNVDNISVAEFGKTGTKRVKILEILTPK